MCHEEETHKRNGSELVRRSRAFSGAHDVHHEQYDFLGGNGAEEARRGGDEGEGEGGRGGEGGEERTARRVAEHVKGDLKGKRRRWPLKKKEGTWRTGRSLHSSAGSSAAAGRSDLDGASRKTESICKQ